MTEETQKQSIPQIPSTKDILDRMDRDLERKKKQLIYRGIGIVIKLIIEIAVIAAVIWLCVRRCS